MAAEPIPHGAETGRCAHCGHPIWIIRRNAKVDTTGHVDPDDKFAEGLHTAYPADN